MAARIYDRWYKLVDGEKVPTQAHGTARRWQVRYEDPNGVERTRTFTRKPDAQRYLDGITADLVTGRYVDPRAGRVRLEDYAERWLAAQTFDVSSRETVTTRLAVHVFPHLGHIELGNIKPSTVQGWIRGRQAVLAPSYVGQILTTLSAVLSAAVEDGKIVSNPCAARSVKAPRVDRRQVVPWTVAEVRALTEAHPLRYRAVPVLAAGCGPRQGECFGLAVDDVDFLRRRVLIRRQVRLLGGRPVFAPPKGGRTREVPLPDVVSVALAESLRRFPAAPVTLPWRDLDGKPTTERLVFLGGDGGALVRNRYNRRVWRPALEAVGVVASRDTGMHQLRHHYASVLLDAGVSIRALAEYLGHTDPGFTLRVYSHMMPASEDRARQAIDGAHEAGAEPARNGEAVE